MNKQFNFNSNFRFTARGRVFALSVALIAGLLAGASPAIAQNEQQARTLEEVIVTAQKREQSLMEVPLSISAISSDTLEDSGLTGVQQLARLRNNHRPHPSAVIAVSSSIASGVRT